VRQGAGSERRLAIRVELLFFLMVVGLVVGFAWIYSVQR
jgi:hypothetical protein